MCGIFGLIVSKDASYSNDFLEKSVKKIASLSESRGKDSSGLCSLNQIDNRIDIIKGPMTIPHLLKNKKINNFFYNAFKKTNKSRYVFGHSRLVTNGSHLEHNNNQPVIKDGLVGVHNGIITNHNELWNKNKDLSKLYDIDTEIMLSLLRKKISNNQFFDQSITSAFNELNGTIATAIVFEDINYFLLSTNNGSLYYMSNNDILIFASEYYILSELNKSINTIIIDNSEINQLKSNHNLIIDLNSFNIEKFSLKKKMINKEIYYNKNKYLIDIKSIEKNNNQLPIVLDINEIHLHKSYKKEKSLLEYPIDKIKNLKRCNKCILPETFPFIEFNELGICNYCINYKKKNVLNNISELQKLVNPYRKNNGKPDVLVPLSGGRDSTYSLHVIKEELDMNVITYTYDWGMVTDLARRNIARVCGKLGVENIIVAADIKWKRENIRKNITAWLKNPHLGMIPLFMTGDKYFFYYAYKIKKQLGIDLELWGVNDLENTNFKTGFSGIKPQFNKKRIYSLLLKDQIKLFSFIGKNIIKSPGYINQSIFDSLGSHASRYFTPKSNYYHIFDYIKWDEDLVNKTIIYNYDWEKSIDTNSTWRIGDGTASFYNYVYNLVVGFSENDTFRSNQIREGMIKRKDALKMIYKENLPRYNSLKWYFEIIGLDYINTIRKVNEISREY